MEKFVEQFNAALTRIEIGGERLKLAISSHKEISEVLLGTEQLRDWGIDPILIGSYARDTGIFEGFKSFNVLRITNKVEQLCSSCDNNPIKLCLMMMCSRRNR